ncbi:MAG: endonuclease/exonuclease/phosphatase family protein [Isosphaeraceae bacterium]|nr:endonuclease/exonuclease/phosphatase family protein [Isosphaeraceae bacterium]
MRISFLFWNINGRDLGRRVARIAAAHSVDILALAECSMSPDTLVGQLNDQSHGGYCLPKSEGRRIRIVTRQSLSALSDDFNDPIGGLTIRKMRVRGMPDLLLAATHFPSRLHWDGNDQTLEATELAHDIVRAEERNGHQRTILIGDLNMNPFDPGVVGAQALNAVMTKELARRESRVVRGRPFPFFYNPMWGFFGDRTDGPSGSYYFAGAKPTNQYWHIFDQLLIRPGLINHLEEVRILDHDGEKGLLSASGLPDTNDASDHLPILFGLRF